MPRTRINSANSVCYIYGEVTFTSQKRHNYNDQESVSPLFGYKVGDQDNKWVPYITLAQQICTSS